MQNNVKLDRKIKIDQGIYGKFLKRPMDFILSLLAIVILSPVLIMVSLLVRGKLGSPVLFKQERPGLNEVLFNMYKFRTMTDATDENGELLPDSVRLTKFGRMLRATSLDELPELFNILRGDMSIVGPRPLLAQYLPLYSDHQKRRHEVKPGLSGLAQVNGRNAISWEDKFNLDVEYVENVSFIGDWEIILLTIKKVFVKEGITSATSVTVEPFRGTMPHSNRKDTQAFPSSASLVKRKLIIIGASGHGKVVADIALKMNSWENIAFLDDDESNKTTMGFEVIGKTADAFKFRDEADFFVAVGNHTARKKILEKLEEDKLSLVKLVHPSAHIGIDVEIGIGSAIMANVVINSSTRIGKGCIINTSSSLDHDNVIEDYVHISPGVRAAGSVRIGKRTWLNQSQLRLKQT